MVEASRHDAWRAGESYDAYMGRWGREFPPQIEVSGVVDGYWQPFAQGAGPAPGYCAKLAADAREKLRRRLQESVPLRADGAIPFKARAWAVKAAFD